jgi:hypothetical protein
MCAKLINYLVILCFLILGTAYANELKVEYSIHEGVQQGSFAFSVSADTEKGAELVIKWQEKAKELCDSDNYDHEPLIVHDKGCGDAYFEDEDGNLRCEILPAGVFGVLKCDV